METLDRLWLPGQDFHPLWTSAFPRRTELSRIDKLNKNHLTRNLVHRLERLGYAVTLSLQQKAA